MKLVILDRDGVINHDSDNFIKSPDEWEAIPGSLEAIARLNQAGYRVVIASNQSGVGRGLFSIEDMNAIHDKMHRELSAIGGVIDAIFFCPHKPNDRCDCRKPKPGLFNEIARRFRTLLIGVPAIGDSLRDIEAARTAGAWPILVRTGNGLATLEKENAELEGVPVHDNLSDVVEHLLAAEDKGRNK